MKTKLILAILIAVPFFAFSQNEKKENYFVGLWELKEVKQPNMPAFRKVAVGTFKQFGEDKKLTIFQVRPTGSIITAYGRYKYLTDTAYLEDLDQSIYFEKTAPGTLKLKKISKDLYQSTYTVDGFDFHEIWGRVFYGTKTLNATLVAR